MLNFYYELYKIFAYKKKMYFKLFPYKSRA